MKRTWWDDFCGADWPAYVAAMVVMGVLQWMGP
jgi:hypothetical protein